MARYVAKNIVAAGLARRCEVALSYVIGGIQPESVTIETFGTGKLPQGRLEKLVQTVFSFGGADCIRDLNLRVPQYQKTAAYGHFGREGEGFRWEDRDKAKILQQLAGL